MGFRRTQHSNINYLIKINPNLFNPAITIITHRQHKIRPGKRR